MTVNLALLVLLFLFTKHFIVDFPMQRPYNYLNKGTYGHFGGILHALEHLFGTAIVLDVISRTHGGLWSMNEVFWLSLFDGVLHYHIDWAKMKYNKYMGWTSTNSEKYWILLGLDQYLHAVTYILIVLLLTK